MIYFFLFIYFFDDSASAKSGVTCTRLHFTSTSGSFSQSPRPNTLWSQWENNEDLTAFARKAKWRWFGTTEVSEALAMQNIWRCVQVRTGASCPLINSPASSECPALRQDTIKRARLVSAVPPHVQPYWLCEMTSTAGSKLGLMLWAVLHSYSLKHVSMTAD